MVKGTFKKGVKKVNDREIVSLFLERDEQVLALVKQKYEKLLYSVSYNILQSECDAEECVADTITRLWQTIPPNEPENMAAYAIRIVKNLSLNKLRFSSAEKRAGDTYSLVLDELSEIIPSDENIEAYVDAKELGRLLNRFLEKLSPEYRVIFVKRYWLFRSVDEISTELGITTTKVTTSLHRTRKKLKDYLKKEGYEI